MGPKRGHSRTRKSSCFRLVSGRRNGEFMLWGRDRERNAGMRKKVNRKNIVEVSGGNGEVVWQEWTSAGGHLLHECCD